MLLSNANEKLINDILQVAALAVNFSFLLFTVDILEMNWKGSASACSTDSVSTDLQFLKMEFSQSQLRNCAQSTEGAGGWIRILWPEAAAGGNLKARPMGRTLDMHVLHQE